MHLPSLATVSRNWATMLDSGVPVVRATELAGRKAKTGQVRRAMSEVSAQVAKGTGLAESVEQTRAFPELFVDLLSTAEKAGAVPEVLRALADHYDQVVNLKREFRSMLLPSALQLLAATLIIALLIFILGIIGDFGGGNGPAFDVTGLGLSGGSGALIFLGIVAAAVVAAILFYKIVTSSVASAKIFHEVLLHVPVVGKTMRNLALARFSWAFSLTQNAGLDIRESLAASLRATGNGAFIGATDRLNELVMSGEPLSSAMEATGLFPDDYLELVMVGENTGTVPEALARVGPQLDDAARRSLRALATFTSYLVWASVAVMIVYIIMRVALTYIGMINEAAAGI